ncbi:MAG: lysylphosphatidylglycerol synthase transmembrane domain-containing protein [Pseudomonadota bacterium]
MRSVWLKLAVSFAGLGGLLWWSDTVQVWDRLRAFDPMWIALSVGLVTAATFAMAHRWQLTARAFGLEIGYADALREYYLGQLVNSVLPGGVAGDVSRAVRTRHAGSLTRAAQSVMAERLLGQVAMCAFLFAGFWGTLLVPAGIPWGGLAWLVLGVITALVGATFIAVRGTHAAARFLRSTAPLLCNPKILIHGVITIACLTFAFYACARATGTAIPAAGWATLIPLVLLAMLIPVSIGGWGWREGAAAALFPLIGAPTSAGIATGIAYGIVLLISVTPAFLLLFVKSFPKPVANKRYPDTP